MTCKIRVKEILSCRRILYAMVVTGFILNAALKILFNITIVAMVKENNQTDTQDRFEWDENQKQNIIGIFFWGFAITKIPSGRLAEIVGSRKVTGYSMVLASLLTILTPTISFWNYYALLVSRVIMGFFIGASWPAIMPLAAKWIPPKEHSVFVACIASTGVGVAITFHLCGFLIDAYGWPSVFYVVGGAALLWSVAWFYLIYDTPQQHPRISIQEKQELDGQIDQSAKTKKLRFREVPWIEIARSGPVWAIVAGQGATFFAYSTLCNEIPSYLSQVLHLDMKQIGAFSELPYWGAYIAALASGFAADELRKSGKVSLTNIRRLFETISLTIPCLCMVVLALWGDVSAVAISAFAITLTVNAISTAGHCVNMLDISANFSGTICGIVNTISAFTAYFSTQLVAGLLKDGHSFNEWHLLFWVMFSVYAVATVVYLVWCSADPQPWDLLERESVEDGKEMQLISEGGAGC